jgi:two-component system, NtrC family, sensor kinase
MSDAVLIVDDSLTVRMDLAEAFTAAGFSPILCATAEEARTELQRCPVQLVVLDVLLPDGDGITLLEELRAAPATAQAAVLMLSSEADVKDRIRGLRTGADEYVGKPYDRGYVVAKAGQLLARHRASQISDTAGAKLVLLIEESPTYREMLTSALQGDGYAVAAAASGEEGLQIAAARRPAAVIIDGQLPGIDGATVVRRMKLDAALRTMPCLLLTARDDPESELNALDAGADAFVRKNEDVQMILARLAAVLRTATSGAGSEETASLAGPKKILAVDDSLTFLNELGAALSGEGYDVVLVRSGEEALEMLAVQPVDCILLDLLMPGLSGKETCRRIKASPGVRDIPLILLTAVEDRDAMIDGLVTGADDYIAKSGDFAVLKARVRAQIRRRQFEEENRSIREALLRKELEAAEARAAREMAEARAVLAVELERKNRDLEAFSYSVSHDLRAPLRGIDGFSQALLEDYSDRLDAKGKDYLSRVRMAAQRMGELIDDLLQLSRVSRADLRREAVDLTAIARTVLAELGRSDPERRVSVAVAEDLRAEGDSRLLRVVLDNLLGNAWKFTARAAEPRIEVGTIAGGETFFVRDNGAGFDMAYADKLFAPFQRLHGTEEFPGTGIGLATVRRIIDRHGGRVWPEAKAGRGATFYFTLSATATGGPE